jgi:WD40 repeat protein
MTTVAVGQKNDIVIVSTDSPNERVVLTGHEDYVSEICYSPDGETIASGDYRGAIRLWVLNKNTRIMRMEGHILPITSLCFSPDGTVLASSSHAINLWDIMTGNLLMSINVHTGSVSSAKFSPYGTQLVSVSRDKTIRLWNTTTGVQEGYFKYPESPTAAEFSNDGSVLVSLFTNRVVRVFDPKIEHGLKQLFSIPYTPRCMCLSPDDETLCIGTMHHGTVLVYNLITGELKHSFITGEILSISYSTDGRSLIRCGFGVKVVLQDADSFEVQHELTFQEACRTMGVKPMSITVLL